jgi:hypothetical protein
MRTIQLGIATMDGRNGYKGQKVKNLYLTFENGTYYWHILTSDGEVHNSDRGYLTRADAQYNLVCKLGRV